MAAKKQARSAREDPARLEYMPPAARIRLRAEADGEQFIKAVVTLFFVEFRDQGWPGDK